VDAKNDPPLEGFTETPRFKVLSGFERFPGTYKEK